MFKSSLFAPLATVLTAVLLQLFAASPSLADGEIFDVAIVLRLIEREDGTPIAPDPHSFQVCIDGPDISTTTLPTVTTPPSTNFPVTGTTLTLDPFPDDDPFCSFGVGSSYPSVAALLDDFPNGAYTITATNVAGDATDSKLVTLSSADVAAYADITAPAPAGTVSTSAPTTVSWDFVDVGGCNVGVPSTCLDFMWVFATKDEEGGGEGDAYLELILDPDTTETSIPGGTFLPNTDYLIDVETRRGAVVTETTDTLGKDVEVYRGTADINKIFVTGGAAPVPIHGTGLLQLLLGATGIAAACRQRRARNSAA